MNKRKREVVEHQCGVCWETLTTEECWHGNGCSHTFCHACLKRWAAQKRTTKYPCCPICRTTFNALEGKGASITVEAQAPDVPSLDVLQTLVQSVVRHARQEGHRGNVVIGIDLGGGDMMRIVTGTETT